MHRARLRSPFWFAVVIGAYVGTAKVGIHLDVAHGVITPVWAPSGIALAALLILGLRYWPAVAVGAFVANVTSDSSAGVAAGIAVGNTLEALVGAALLRRFGFRPELDRVRSVIALTVWGALLSTAIAATNGVTILTLADQRQDPYGTAWVLWWFGDAVGDLMVAPLLLVLFAWRRARLTTAQLIEGAALLTALAGASVVVFVAGAWRYPYLLFPPLLWAAIRFKSVGAATASFVVGAIGTWGAVAGKVPFGAETATERVQIAQALFALIAVSLLVVGATLEEREAGSSALATTASRLSEAQALAHIGSWEWDIRRDAVTWSDELYRIFGTEPDSGSVDYASYLERLHPADRAFVNSTVQRAIAERRPFAFEHRIVRLDGTERVVSSRGQVIVEDDQLVAMLGTAQDVTEQRQAERLREDILSAVSHELRTPLTAVLGFAVTLEQRRNELSDEELGRILAELVGGARRLERLLVDLLDVERLRRGAVEISRERVDVLELVERTVAACELNGRHVRLDALEDDLMLAVEDEGPGIANEHKEDVFEIFNRGAKVLSATPGVGIGLALVSRFAEAHGGRSWVEDRPGGGASFRVLLPGCVVG